MNGGRPMAEFIQTATMAFQLIDWSGAISASGANSNLGELFVQVSKLMNSEVRGDNGK